MRQSFRGGFTLVELLVVMAIIGILVALLLPAVQAARESARRMSCSNHLKQMGLALQNFEVQQGTFPTCWQPPKGVALGNTSGWSAQALILPYLEKQSVYDYINFEAGYETAKVADSSGKLIPLGAVRIPTYVCPSETRDEARRTNGVAEHYPLNYAVNTGIWFVFDPVSRMGGDGAFVPARPLRPRDMLDGLSNTLAAAEVKAWNPHFRNAGLADPTFVSPGDLCALGGQFKEDSGHTEWVDGRAHQIGFTAAFAPNTEVLCDVGGRLFDVDWTNMQEGKSVTVKTYAAVTSRSYHPQGVHSLRMDGSVHFTSENIELAIWRALATRSKKDSIELP